MIHINGLARLGRDPELRYTDKGDAVASLSLAFSWGKKNPDTGYRETTWVEAALWGARAEALVPYLHKGDLVAVVVENPHLEFFESQRGPGAKIAGRISDLALTSSREESQPRAPSFADAPPAAPDRPRMAAAGRVAPPPRTAPAAPPRGYSTQPRGGPTGFDDMDSDIPF